MLRFPKMDVALNAESGDLTDSAEGEGKAESFLATVSDHLQDVGDQEAVVYLRSRGHDCHEQVAKLIESWKIAERERLDEHNKKNRGSEANTINIADFSPFRLRDFWEAGSLGDYSIEATMLRTVEWCQVSGFEPWWHRLAHIHKAQLLQGGAKEPTGAAYWLFNMVRSDYAIELMPGVLNGYLESISLVGQNRRPPWIEDGAQGLSNLEQHLAHASAIVFAHHRLVSDSSDTELIEEAVASLSKHQEQNGAWRTVTNDGAASIEATAMAVHALALAQPPEWPRMAALARDWLWKVQQGGGSWEEPGGPHSVCLTVLVLDAIALANGVDNVTFRLQQSRPEILDTPHDSSDAAEPAGATSNNRGPRTRLPVKAWEDVEITFLSDERVEIRCGRETETCNYGELGFLDRRNGKPIRAWVVLQVLAALEDGRALEQTAASVEWSMLEKRVQEIRRLFRAYFGISTDPLPYVTGSGYRPLLRIRRSRSSDY